MKVINLVAQIVNSNHRKFFLCVVVFSILLQIVAVWITAEGEGLPYGFYVLLRFATCGAFAWTVFRVKNPVWRFCLAVAAVVYNPVIPVHLGDREAWSVINVISIVALIVSIISIKYQAKIESKKTGERES